MQNQQSLLNKKKLVIAMSLALMGSVMTGCSSSDGGGAGVTGGSTILAKGGIGGNAEAARGGDGGEFTIFNEGTSGGIEIRKSGSANTSLTPPAIPTEANLGATPLSITTDTSIDTAILFIAIADAAGALTVGD